MWQVFLMYALFGSIFTVGKVALAASQPFFLTGMRMLLAGAVMTVYLFFRQPAALRLSRSAWFTLFWVAFFNVFVTNAFEFWGLQYMDAGKTCLIYSLSPFAAAFIGYFFHGERLSGKKWRGLAIGFLSFLPLMTAPWFEKSSANDSVMELWAEGALMVSALTAVVGWILVKKLMTEEEVAHPVINGLSFLLAGGMCLLTSLTVESWEPVPVSLWTDFLWTLLYIVIVHNLICYSIYASSLKRFSVTFMAFAGLSNPLFAGIFGWVFLQEQMTWAFCLALAGISMGLYLFYQEEAKSVATTTS
jgi:drug/metabolite transporter (DMT)-like permease